MTLDSNQKELFLANFLKYGGMSLSSSGGLLTAFSLAVEGSWLAHYKTLSRNLPRNTFKYAQSFNTKLLLAGLTFFSGGTSRLTLGSPRKCVTGPYFNQTSTANFTPCTLV